MNTNKTIHGSIKYLASAITLVIILSFIYLIQKNFAQKNNYKITPKRHTKPILNIENLKQKLLEGRKLGKNGQIKKEIAVYTEILKYEKTFSVIHTKLAEALTKDKQYKKAEYHLKKANELLPNDKTVNVFLGIVLRQQNKFSESAQYLKKILALYPNYYEANLELSRTYYELKMYDKALTYGIKAENLNKNNIYALLQIAYTYNQKGDLDEAIKIYKKILDIKPNLANANYNLGYTFKIKGQLQKALRYISKAIKLKPDYLDAHIAKAQVNISLGNYQEGWDEYEWRWGLFGIDHKQYRNSMWDGSDIKGKTILLRTEQGLGDTLQFVRYAKIVKEMGATVICKVQKPLVKILSSCPYIDKVVGSLDDSITHDKHAQLMSLPRILKTAPQTIPAEIPYLYADPTLEKIWKEKLKKDTNFKVGLCWHVDPVHEKTKSPWSLRSIQLKQFKSLSKLTGISFYSLQKFKDYQQIAKSPDGLTVQFFGPDFDEKNGAFMDSAAIIKNLDLVITVDTCIAHLAGALGKPVWMLLPFAPDCRWHLEDTNTAWYPKMKLFRQKKPQNWIAPIHMITTELGNILKNKKTT